MSYVSHLNFGGLQRPTLGGGNKCRGIQNNFELFIPAKTLLSFGIDWKQIGQEFSSFCLIEQKTYRGKTGMKNNVFCILGNNFCNCERRRELKWLGESSYVELMMNEVEKQFSRLFCPDRQCNFPWQGGLSEQMRQQSSPLLEDAVLAWCYM